MLVVQLIRPGLPAHGGRRPIGPMVERGRLCLVVAERGLSVCIDGRGGHRTVCMAVCPAFRSALRLPVSPLAPPLFPGHIHPGGIHAIGINRGCNGRKQKSIHTAAPNVASAAFRSPCSPFFFSSRTHPCLTHSFLSLVQFHVDVAHLPWECRTAGSEKEDSALAVYHVMLALLRLTIASWCTCCVNVAHVSCLMLFSPISTHLCSSLYSWCMYIYLLFGGSACYQRVFAPIQCLLFVVAPEILRFCFGKLSSHACCWYRRFFARFNLPCAYSLLVSFRSVRVSGGISCVCGTASFVVVALAAHIAHAQVGNCVSCSLHRGSELGIRGVLHFLRHLRRQ